MIANVIVALNYVYFFLNLQQQFQIARRVAIIFV